MEIPIVMPQMGQSMAEGVIVKWLKRAGDAVGADEPIVEIESDKISIAVESPAAGTLAGCLKREGEKAAVGDVIGLLAVEETESAAPESRPHLAVPGEQVRVSTDAPLPGHAAGMPGITRAWLSPYVMRLALQNDISMAELQRLPGTGREGRLTRNDLLHYLARRRPAGAVVGAEEVDAAALAESGEVIPMTSKRRTIADHMVQSIHTSAHVTMVHAVDMTSVAALRERTKDAFFKAHQARLTYTAVILFVTARVLREFPAINASVSGSNIVLRKDVNIGCAVALPDESLVVPVVKQADRKSFPDIARELERLIALARDKSLRREDVEGGTFTISNFGAFGSLIGTPIIHQPQVAILGMGAVFKAPVVVDGAVCVRDQVYLSFSFDHRVIDGAMGGRFLNAIQKQTEALTAADLDISG